MVVKLDPKELKRARIAVLLGGLSSEREVSLQSGDAVMQALKRRGYSAVGIDVDRTVGQRLLEERAQVAFIALHGRQGEDGCIQGLLEAMQIPYTGSGVLASAMAMDKVVSKRLFTLADLPTPAWCYPATREAVMALGLPAVIKPRNEGSSVGLTVVRSEAEIAPAIERARGPARALAERYVKGRELSVGVLGEGEDARCLGSLEIRPAEGIYDYDAKYNRNDTEYVVPAPVPESVSRRIGELALAVHRLLGCGGATRTDLLWDGAGEPQLLEVNTLPGMTSHSLLPKIAAHAGLSYDDLVEVMLQGASLKNAIEERG